MASFLRADAPIRIPKRRGIEILPLSLPSFFLLSRRDRDYPNELTEKEDGREKRSMLVGEISKRGSRRGRRKGSAKREGKLKYHRRERILRISNG